MPKDKKTIELIGKITGGLVISSIDFTLLVAALAGGLILFGPGAYDYEKKRKRQFEASIKAADWAYSKWGRSKFRKALSRATGQGLFFQIDSHHQLTQQGVERIENIIPSYKVHQAWDGRLWLITYDVAEDRRRSRRDKLRNFLKKTGCRLIQKSVWLTLRDPRKWLKPEIARLKLRGNVIISCLGKDGSLGDENINQLVARIFDLDSINDKYRQWLKKVKKNINNPGLADGFEYLFLLSQDPVVPPEFLPPNWKGDEAKKFFDNYLSNNMPYLKDYL